MSNEVLDEQFKPQREGPVLCLEKQGGLIKEYYREAAGITVYQSAILLPDQTRFWTVPIDILMDYVPRHILR